MVIVFCCEIVVVGNWWWLVVWYFLIVVVVDLVVWFCEFGVLWLDIGSCEWCYWCVFCLVIVVSSGWRLFDLVVIFVVVFVMWCLLLCLCGNDGWFFCCLFCWWRCGRCWCCFYRGMLLFIVVVWDWMCGRILGFLELNIFVCEFYLLCDERLFFGCCCW